MKTDKLRDVRNPLQKETWDMRVGNIKPVFCPYCKTYNAYGIGDHTECNNCDRVWAS